MSICSIFLRTYGHLNMVCRAVLSRHESTQVLVLKTGGKYRNEVWLDGLIDEAFRLARE